MSNHLTPSLVGILEAHTQREIYQRSQHTATEERAKQVASLLIQSIVAGVPIYTERYNRGAVDDPSLTTRANVAAILNLIGTRDPNAGHLASSPVILGRDVNISGVLYPEVAAALSNVAIDDSHQSSDIDPRAVTPEQILEGTAIMFAIEGVKQTPDIAGSISAWTAARDMPDTYLGRDHYVDPAKLGHVAVVMLDAMADPELNPQFYTRDFVEGVSPDLANAFYLFPDRVKD